ncbi:MAG: metallophosphoesterase [Myxococcota bacterium]
MLRLLLVLAVATTLWGLIHAYMHRRLFSTWKAQGWRRRVAQAIFWFGFALGPSTMAISRMSGGELPLAFVFPAWVWIGMAFLLFCFLVFRDVGLGAFRGVRRLMGKPLSEERRDFLTRTTNAGVLGVTGAFTGLGLYEALTPPELVEVDVPIAGLPAALDGYRIAQISDVHVGPTIKGGFVEHIVGRVNELEADLVAVTGDLVDGSVAELRQHMGAFAELRGRDGVFFCTGNHEYYSGALEWVEEVRRFGWTPLVNEHRVVERDGAKVLVGGCTDYSAHRMMESHRSDPAKAKEGAPECDVSLLLAHQPKSIDAAEAAGFDLQLSGHTHGGQFFPPSLFVGFAHPFHEGLGKQGDTWIYVNRGTGYWGPPIRAGVPAEITLLRLVRA